ncbi:Uncharacterised protein [Streptococcus pseudopneumoniae]|nr:Uncharacterised protein [Streptococcus pseudopneumoniae]COD24207.1 Uncharacterised protein [Streptococcus pseudopneumoniae]COO15890.1 Uncharacterised protein [Streptococcus pseudopneumoniae]
MQDNYTTKAKQKKENQIEKLPLCLEKLLKLTIHTEIKRETV